MYPFGYRPGGGPYWLVGLPGNGGNEGGLLAWNADRSVRLSKGLGGGVGGALSVIECCGVI